ncbi:MAG: BREX-1 system adenine-specific DNA-methyltransferase PglX [Pseudoalteromonas prydzensis]|uniref:BREX-1 system adenine-specific DNA-methyltransferase PglX n=1 Tax=Pseudoalteromonas prydzensis TaxID=182141 RepID=UPI003F9A1CF8
MNTAKLKKYAPQARREFISAVSKQLNQLGIYSDKQIADVKEQGSVLSIEGKAFPIGINTARERLVRKVKNFGYTQLIEQVAYTWFNRLCAVRYMEIHDYLGHGFRVLSHPDNPKGFEIIDHAQDAADELGLDRARIIELKLAGNKDEELYRELLLGQCHKLHEAMPFLFDALDDETELLLPDNLTRTDSILRGLVDSIPEEDWQQVEVIGWLYQFYISEKKDQVMGKVVKSEDIPAATQLFTPNWIVKYLVQNSVGRQWLQTYPDSAIKSQMEYYIEPAEQSDEVNQQLKAITPESIEPETIKVLDPACGSGHILIEAYNVLKAIYEERGFRSRDIPKMILENNLYGLDIDDRAAQLSGFALMMMARDDDKRIFTRNVRLNVLSLQESNHIDLPTLWKALNLSGSWQSGTSQGLFSDEEQDLSSFNADNRYQLLKRTLARFTQAKTFGSLIDVPSDDHEQLKELMGTLVELQESGDSMQKPAAKQLIEIVHQALVLSIRYDAVIANPPYMGRRGMNKELKEHAKSYFPNSKSDLFAVFMERAQALIKYNGFNAQINMQSWMFLSSYEKLRFLLLKENMIITLAHLGARAFNQISGEVVQTVAWVFNKTKLNKYQPKFYRLVDGDEDEKREALINRLFEHGSTSQKEFEKIPGSPIAYWLNQKVFDSIHQSRQLKEIASSRAGMTSGDNDYFTRQWHEIDVNKMSDECKSWEDAIASGKRWFPYNKGGAYKKWYGNITLVLRYDEEYRNKLKVTGNNCASEECYFKEGITWTDLTSGRLGGRFLEHGSVFDIAGHCAYPKVENGHFLALGLMNTNFINDLSKVINATMHFQPGDFRKLPYPNELNEEKIISLVKEVVDISKVDWDSFETSWRFKSPWIFKNKTCNLKEDYQRYLDYGNAQIRSVKLMEEELNSLFNTAFGISDLFDSTVPLDQITLECNQYFLFSSDHDAKFRSKVVVDLISFIVGCIIGRFSIENLGITDSYSSDVEDNFLIDDDGIIPLTDIEWFKDDATNKVREFIQVVWGEQYVQENIDFIVESLCLNAIKSKKSESALETIRRYLSTQFYKDHLKTYKKRPIYWLFSSGKQKAFECLVYLHRYNEGTLSRMRTEYVTPLLGKYDAYAEQLEKQIETADSTSEANRFKKELDALIKKQVELREFDDKLKHYADMRISLDLDDGVKVNYGKFGDLLADVKAITGSAPEVN